jgi:hypothetical protein
MVGADMALETLTYSPRSNLSRFLALEHFIQFSHRESFVFYVTQS